MCKKSMFWDLILRYELLTFVWAHRENFLLYVEVLEKLTLLFLPRIMLII